MQKLVIGITAARSVGLIKGQCKYFAAKDFRVYLLAPKTETTLQYCADEGCTLLPVSFEREISLIKDFLALIKTIYYFASIRPDIINVGTPKASLLGMIAGWVCFVRKRVYTCRGLRYESEAGKKRKVLVFFEKITSRLSHKIVCISRSVEELGIHDSIFDAKKTVVIGNGSSNGIDLKLFNKNRIKFEAQESVRESLNINRDDFVFGFAGRLVDRKGINELYEAFVLLEKEMPDVKLVMVGPVEEIQIKDRVILDKYYSHGKISMVGRIDFEEVPLYMSIFDCFVLPTWAEGFGNVLIQAAALGVPIISNYVTGCKDAVKDNFNGVLIKDTKEPIILKKAMASLISNRDELERLGKNGLEWAAGFDQNRIWGGLSSIYRN